MKTKNMAQLFCAVLFAALCGTAVHGEAAAAVSPAESAQAAASSGSERDEFLPLSYAPSLPRKDIPAGAHPRLMAKNRGMVFDLTDRDSTMKFNGWDTLAGVGDHRRLSDAELQWSVFYEHSDSRFRLENEDSFRARGDFLYNGGGAVVRYTKDSGWYGEGSIRMGSMEVTMDSITRGSMTMHFGLGSSSLYRAYHLGAGKLIPLGEGRTLDLYGRYFRTDLNGSDFSVGGTRYEYSDVTKDIVRLGVRLKGNEDRPLRFFFGAAWEYEFRGEAGMTIENRGSFREGFGGNSAMAEAGLRWIPSRRSPWEINLGTRAYAGNREGWAAVLHTSHTF